MASSLSSTGTFEHQLQTRLAPVVEAASRNILAPQLDSRLAALEAALEARLDGIGKGVAMANQATSAILSSQDIARRFEVVRGEMREDQTAHQQHIADLYEQTMTAIAERIAEHETAIDQRIATLEALTLGTLFRLMVRRLIGL